jgi:hypothetical protein
LISSFRFSELHALERIAAWRLTKINFELLWKLAGSNAIGRGPWLRKDVDGMPNRIKIGMFNTRCAAPLSYCRVALNRWKATPMI